MRAITLPLRSLARARSGIAMTEFALCMPVLIALVMYGLETVNMAYATQKIGDIATLTVDNVSRVRVGISEADVTDTLNGIKSSGGNLNFGANGRIIVSSLRPVLDMSGNVTGQVIRWQRCSGALNTTSTYGLEGASLGTVGMGPVGRKVTASSGNEVIFVEVIYTYQPLISNSFFGVTTLRSITSMNVRERTSNDLTPIGTAASCATFAA